MMTIMNKMKKFKVKALYQNSLIFYLIRNLCLTRILMNLILRMKSYSLRRLMKILNYSKKKKLQFNNNQKK